MREDPLGGKPRRVSGGLIGAVFVLLFAGFMLLMAGAVRECGAEAQYVVAVVGFGVAFTAVLVELHTGADEAHALTYFAALVEIVWFLMIFDGVERCA